MKVIVSGAFAALDSAGVRFLHEAGRHGEVHVLLWSDAACRRITGHAPKFSEAERAYVVGAIRQVAGLRVSSDSLEPGSLPDSLGFAPAAWITGTEFAAPRQEFCQRHGLDCRVIDGAALAGFPDDPEPRQVSDAGPPRVVVTGCYDYFHSGHVRFFEEVSALGDLYVVVGNDPNVRELKGAGHPLFPATQRRFVVGAVRQVRRALISSGMGWMDAAPEIAWIRPARYVVNDDGDRPEKRNFCRQHGIEYVVLRRLPKEGLVRRSSTDLRGF
jgi:cytidyltransferase-like protein